MAEYSKINGYEAITDTEIETFLNQPDIAWNPSMAKEQIYTQSWVEHFKNNNESWALWRRVGYPNQTFTIVTFDPVMVIGEEQRIPRRKKFSFPAEGSPNYDNEVDRFETMMENSDFGSIDNEFGHLWWDVK